MQRRKVDVVFVQETSWKGSKARGTVAGLKLYYHCVEWKGNGLGVILRETYTKNDVELKGVSDKDENYQAGT